MQCSQCGSTLADETTDCPVCDAGPAQAGEWAGPAQAGEWAQPAQAGEWAGPAGGVGGMPVVRPVNPALYILSAFLCPLFGGVLFGMAVSEPGQSGLMVLAPIPLLVGCVAIGVLVYKSWAALQDGYARTTPGKAAGLLFIPIFSLFWMFIAIGAWGYSYNAFAERHHLRGFRTSPSLFFGWVLCPLVPIANIALLVITPIGIAQMCRGINEVARLGAGPAVPTARALR